MSKKNRNKNRVREAAATTGLTSSPVQEAAAIRPKDEKDEDLRREFKNLALTILFILALLATLYYYDQKSQILDQATAWVFGLF